MGVFSNLTLTCAGYARVVGIAEKKDQQEEASFLKPPRFPVQISQGIFDIAVHFHIDTVTMKIAFIHPDLGIGTSTLFLSR